MLLGSGLSEELLDIAEACTALLRSGFGTSSGLGCGFFSGNAGSDVAGAAAVGQMTLRLEREG